MDYNPALLAALRAKLAGAATPEEVQAEMQDQFNQFTPDPSSMGSVEQPAVDLTPSNIVTPPSPPKVGPDSLAGYMPQKDPVAESLRKQIEEKTQASLAAQQQAVEQSQANYDKLAQTPLQANYSGLGDLYNLLDRTGNKMEVKAPKQGPEERRAELQKLLEGINKQKGDISENQIKFLKTELGDRQSADLAKMMFPQKRLEVQNDRMDRNEHMNIVRSLNNNKGMSDRLAQYQNLGNAMAVMANAKKITPQQIHEFQQSVRSNLGIRGTSGVGERESTYLDSLGLRSENFRQFLTGNPADIAKDNEIVKHIKDLAQQEMDNIKSQYTDSLDSVSEGRASMYERRPDLQSDLQKKIKSMSKRVSANTANASQGKMTNEKPVDHAAGAAAELARRGIH